MLSNLHMPRHIKHIMISNIEFSKHRFLVEHDRETGEEQSIVVWTSKRMADDRLPKRAAELREQGRRRRGRPRLRWEDCVKRDVKKAGEEEDWKKKTRDRGGWKRLADEAVKSCRQHLTTDKGKKGRDREISRSTD